MTKVLILGATGIFGSRLTRHLARHVTGKQAIEIIATSRSLQKAEALADDIRANFKDCKISGAQVDHGAGFEQSLDEIAPDIVVDCSGPFQLSDYRVAEIVISKGIHFIDLADARDYLQGFAQSLDALATRNNVGAYCGASTTPALSTSVVAEQTKDWQRVDLVKLAICPAGQSPVGSSVIQAMLSYAGRKVPVWREGALQSTIAWARQEPIHVPHIGHRRIAPVDTFDAFYLGARFNVRSSVSFHAGLESQIEQWGLWFLAKLVQFGLISGLIPLAGFLVKARSLTRLLTSHRGGMIIIAKGLDQNGDYVENIWTLVAENDEGLHVPILAAAALIGKISAGEPAIGAMVADQALELDEIVAEMEPYKITSQMNAVTHTDSIYVKKLGRESFERMPEVVKDLHKTSGAAVWTGQADISGGANIFAKIIRKVIGFPKAGNNVPLTFSVDRTFKDEVVESETGFEHWTRNFDGRIFHSKLSCSDDKIFREQFGSFTFDIDLKADNKRLEMPVKGWRFGAIPLPLLLAPKSDSFEYEDDEGRFCFDVKITLPLIGLLVHYKGWLEPQ